MPAVRVVWWDSSSSTFAVPSAKPLNPLVRGEASSEEPEMHTKNDKKTLSPPAHPLSPNRRKQSAPRLLRGKGVRGSGGP